MPEHVISCDCGNVLTVDSRQAGETITCSCGTEVDIPRLSDLKKMPLASAPPPPSASWSIEQGLTFAAGSLVILVALVCLVTFLFEWGGLDTTDRRLEQLSIGHQIIDAQPYLESFTSFLRLKQQGIGRKVTPEYVKNQRRAATLLTRMYICGGAILAGGFISVISIFLRRRAPQRKPAPASA